MFNFFKPKPKTEKIQVTTICWSLSGLDCVSCATNIDLTLEEIKGIINSKTNYAKQQLTVKFQPELTSPDFIRQAIEKLGYRVLD